MKDPNPKPCGACPFRRESVAGYLGHDNPQYFAALAMSDHEMPCHLTVNYEKRGWEERAKRTAHQCAGRAVFLANQCKLPVNRAIKLLPADRKTVFQFAHEFRAHHEEGRRGMGR